MAVINGNNNPNFLEGTAGNDLILGRGKRDTLLGLGGNDRLRGGGGNDFLDGGDGNDDLFGQGGKDRFIGSSGNDFIDGGKKNDIVDYSGLGRAVTLEAVGQIRKSGLGTDTILNIETIIGATGRRNSIDGSTGTSPSTSFVIDLGNEDLTIQGIPVLGDIDFAIKNFVDAIGTSQDDFITGSSEDNVLQGGLGSDIFGGSAGDDTIAGNDLAGNSDLNNDGTETIDIVDYNGLGRAITLLPTGEVNKGLLGTDQLIRVETIIGEVGRNNTIDASDTPPASGGSINVDLDAESLDIDTNAAPGIISRTVKNFVNVIGTSQEDFIAGSSNNNVLQGGDGNDFFAGSAGNDIIAGNDLDGNNDFNNDTVDYTGIGKAITLSSSGIVEKGTSGTDELIRVETIIGEAGQDNKVDGSGASASLDIDLEAETLEVNVGGAIGTLDRTIVNFVDATGGDANDTISGTAGDNKLKGKKGNDSFLATEGNDKITGGRGSDTVNYSTLNTAITLLPTGEIDKGGFGTDQLVKIENIIGRANKDNTIDASGAGAGTSINVDLDAESLEVTGVPVLSSIDFTVTNFKNVIGTSNADTITDNSSNNSLEGGAGKDTIQTSGGNDTVSGGDGKDTIIADIGQDELTGGAGKDIFVLGSGNQAFFDDAGASDFALITDFVSGEDKIKLAEDLPTPYSFSNLGSSTTISISPLFNGGDFELIAIINGSFDPTNDIAEPTYQA